MKTSGGELSMDTGAVLMRDGDVLVGMLTWSDGIVRFEGHLGKSVKQAVELLDFPIVLSTAEEGDVFEVSFTKDGIKTVGNCDPAAETFFEAVACLRKKT